MDPAKHGLQKGIPAPFCLHLKSERLSSIMRLFWVKATVRRPSASFPCLAGTGVWVHAPGHRQTYRDFFEPGNLQNLPHGHRRLGLSLQSLFLHPCFLARSKARSEPGPVEVRSRNPPFSQVFSPALSAGGSAHHPGRGRAAPGEGHAANASASCASCIHASGVPRITNQSKSHPPHSDAFGIPWDAFCIGIFDSAGAVLLIQPDLAVDTAQEPAKAEVEVPKTCLKARRKASSCPSGGSFMFRLYPFKSSNLAWC